MDTLNDILASYVARGSETKDKLLGAGFSVVTKDDILFEGATGRIDLPADSSPWDLDTLTWYASMTKLATAIAILQLSERNLITLDEDIRPRVPFLAANKILRGFHPDTDEPILDPNTQPISLRSLLLHITGLHYDILEQNTMKYRRQQHTESQHNLTFTLEGISVPFLHEPGEKWTYGVGPEWAAVVLEQVTGQRYSDYMRENVFAPLGMHDTSFWPTKELNGGKGRSPAPIPYRGPDGALVSAPFPVPVDEHPLESGGAGLFSTARDYAKLLRGLLQGKLLSKEGIDLLLAPQLHEELQASIMSVVGSKLDQYAPEYPPGTPINFGYGGMINLEDIPGKRAGGSVMWSGFVNPHWWIDRKNGIAGILQASLLPHADPVVAKLYDELEREVYKNLAGQ